MRPWVVFFCLLFSAGVAGRGSDRIPLAEWFANHTTEHHTPSVAPDNTRPVMTKLAPDDDVTSSIGPIMIDDAARVEPRYPASVILLEEICEALAAAAQSHDLPVPFFARLIWQESRFDPRAVSPAGARGVAQFMPRIAAALDLKDPHDPIAALPVAARVLQSHYNTFGNLGLAAAAYNAGTRRVVNWLARRGRLPTETHNYVLTITGHAPEQWTEPKSLDLVQKLPPRAPCHGVAELSHAAETAKVDVQLGATLAKMIETARRANSSKMKTAKPSKSKARKFADNRTKAKSPAKARVRVAESSGRR